MNDVVGQLLIQFMTRTPPRSPSVQLSLPRSRTQRALGRGHANQLFSVLPKSAVLCPGILTAMSRITAVLESQDGGRKLRQSPRSSQSSPPPLIIISSGVAVTIIKEAENHSFTKIIFLTDTWVLLHGVPEDRIFSLKMARFGPLHRDHAKYPKFILYELAYWNIVLSQL